uniref:AAA+ ATPase domain-containing protein n=1 Tax=Vitis vinifera TaxID=29760 RepID=A5BDE7_VITVI|nr:hypothetical protein VITISV_041822 [Vitis vinifera]
MTSMASLLSTYTTFAAAAMLLRTVLNEARSQINQFIPQYVQERIWSKIGGIFGNRHSSSHMTLIMDECDNYITNQFYEASEIYLRAKVSPSVTKLKVFQAPDDKNPSVTIKNGEKFTEVFQGIQLQWESFCIEKTRNEYYDRGGEIKSIELSFPRKNMDKILSSYLPYVLERSKAIRKENRVLKLHSYNGSWESTNLDHPSTFETLAMDSKLKENLINDLDRFVRRSQFYRRVGKAWKRGYLLYGPPGTGKSSLIAAMANYLKFDIYDLELTSLHSNYELRRLLVSTKNQSILVIEDIDCSVALQDRRSGGCGQGNSQLTLSGFLNFIDGLWSSCGNERIIVFTTNHKDKLDPALLRPGHMDVHIHMSYCNPCGFKTLAFNYLDISNHKLFPEIEKLLMEVEVTPAEIAEEFMKSEDADVALEGLVEFLRRVKMVRNGSDGRQGKEEVAESGNQVKTNNKEKARDEEDL